MAVFTSFLFSKRRKKKRDGWFYRVSGICVSRIFRVSKSTVQHDNKLVRVSIIDGCNLRGNLEEKGQHEKILQFLQDMQVSLENPKQHIVSGNEEVDTIFNYYWDKAEQLGVKMDCKVSISKEISIPMYDSSVLLGNLLGNAIEAAAKTKDGYVSVRLLGEKKMLAMQVKNSYDGVLKKRGEQFVSTKKEKGHGIGLRNVRELVERRQGSLQLDYDEKEFRVEVVIYV